jgi:hypothetical protein
METKLHSTSTSASCCIERYMPLQSKKRKHFITINRLATWGLGSGKGSAGRQINPLRVHAQERGGILRL